MSSKSKLVYRDPVEYYDKVLSKRKPVRRSYNGNSKKATGWRKMNEDLHRKFIEKKK